MEIPGQTGENRKVKLNKFVRACLVTTLFSMSMLYIGSARAGNVDWSIHFDWILPAPNHGHGHGHDHGGWNNGHDHRNYVNCPQYYMRHGCNQYGYNCVRLPHSECRNGEFVGPYHPPYHDHRGTVHQHTWRCYQRHWHGAHFSHQHHADGHHEHDPYMMNNR